MKPKKVKSNIDPKTKKPFKMYAIRAMPLESDEDDILYWTQTDGWSHDEDYARLFAGRQAANALALHLNGPSDAYGALEVIEAKTIQQSNQKTFTEKDIESVKIMTCIETNLRYAKTALNCIIGLINNHPEKLQFANTGSRGLISEALEDVDTVLTRDAAFSTVRD